MERAWIVAAVALFGLTGSAAAWEPDVDQIAQRKMIGLAKKKILACLGEPDKRVRIGSTDIWTYRNGEARIESPFFAPVLSMSATAPAVLGQSCNVNVIMTNGAVSQVAYAGANGGLLPLGEQCIFAVTNCTTPPAPVVVRAKY
jgi:hypothetical protein